MKDKDSEQLRENYQKRVAQGEQSNKIIEDLRTDGFTIIEAIKIVRMLYQMNLKDAHQAIASHPAWQDVVRNAEPLHNEIEKALKLAARFARRKPAEPQD
ncbi:MAG TPA: hypothetical protein VN729_05330 [Ktedonobacteraceae bacterium]|nr:hypothetical protein [Ktedonobacteraceae bacterium]